MKMSNLYKLGAMLCFIGTSACVMKGGPIELGAAFLVLSGIFNVAEEVAKIREHLQEKDND